MQLQIANIDSLALLCEGHFASAKRGGETRALTILPASDISETVLSNAPGCAKYLLDGKLAILSTVGETPESFCDALIGYFKTRAHAAVMVGMVMYGGESDLRFRQPESPHGTLAVTTALTNLQAAKQAGEPYIISDLTSLVDQTQ